MTRHRADGQPWYTTVIINCRVPEQLANSIKLLCLDPATGKMPRRGWSAVIERGMELWLEEQRRLAGNDGRGTDRSSPVHADGQPTLQTGS